jgi:D-alanine-D-alanine ligase
MSTGPLTVGVAFGGVAPEHEVSIISALQAAAALDRDRYRPLPLYIAKDGRWYTGDALLEVENFRDVDALLDEAVPVALQPTPHGTLELVEVRASGALGRFFRPPRRYTVDVVLPGLHGGAGEDGSLQGLCETFNVPYTGSGVFGSALGMDKELSKRFCHEAGVPVVDFVAFREGEWAHREEEGLDRCEREIGYPMIVKPARCGSSIGIARAETRDALDAAIEDAFRYDDKVVVERAVDPMREINCSILGDAHEATPSVLEEPLPSDDDEVLTFQDKYMREDDDAAPGAKQGGPGGMASLDRLIPARLSEERTQEIQDLAVRIFRLFECAGVARIDFMIDEDTDQVYFNEINTIPGSFSFYLWDPEGADDADLPERVPFDELVHRMVQLARRRHREKNGRIQTYDVNLLAERSLHGLKGAKAGEDE